MKQPVVRRPWLLRCPPFLRSSVPPLPPYLQGLESEKVALEAQIAAAPSDDGGESARVQQHLEGLLAQASDGQARMKEAMAAAAASQDFESCVSLRDKLVLLDALHGRLGDGSVSTESGASECEQELSGLLNGLGS